MKEVNLFEGPIPGQSLTDLPKNSPWENPPEINELEEAVKYYIEKLSKPEVLDDIALVFELGANVEDFVEVITTMGTMKGIHSVDLQMLTAPMVETYLKGVLTFYDIDAPENVLDGSGVETEREKMRMKAVFDDAISKSKAKGADEGTELLETLAETTEGMADEPLQEEADIAEPEVTPSQGLMSREMM